MRTRHLIAAVLLSTATVGTAQAAPRRAPPTEASPELMQLKAELTNDAPTDSKFRALCDADGYPLVGNIATKGPSHRPTVAGYCAGVRKAEGREAKPQKPVKSKKVKPARTAAK